MTIFLITKSKSTATEQQASEEINCVTIALINNFITCPENYNTKNKKGFPGGSDGKEATPLQYSFLENPHGQRSLAGNSVWSGKESDIPEQLSTAQAEEEERLG